MLLRKALHPIIFNRPAPTFLGKTEGVATTSGATHTTSHIVTPDTKCLVALVHYYATSAVALLSCAWGASSMILGASAADSVQPTRSSLGLYYLLNPPPGTANGVATLGAAINRHFNVVWLNLANVLNIGVTGTDNVFSTNDLEIQMMALRPYLTLFGVMCNDRSDAGAFNSNITKESQISAAGSGFTFVTTTGRLEARHGEALDPIYTRNGTGGPSDGGAMLAASFYNF